ncbi:MAG: response regulator [Pseudomonadota bacterium]
MPRIMLATQNDMMRRYVGQKLGRAGHSVCRVEDFDIALTLLCEMSYDVLIASVDADDAEGLAFAHEARRIDPDMHVVFMTGFAIVPLECQEDDEDGLYDRLGAPAHLSRVVDEIGRLMAA